MMEVREDLEILIEKMKISSEDYIKGKNIVEESLSLKKKIDEMYRNMYKDMYRNVYKDMYKELNSKVVCYCNICQLI